MFEIVKSPCVKICKLDENKICSGCGRTLDEIMHWTKYDETFKSEVKLISKLRLAEKNNLNHE